MKKVLFILRAVRSGGSATSMLNLMDLLKKRGYETDLFLFQREGCFLDRAESVANLLPEERIISSIMCQRDELKDKGLIALLIRMSFVICHRIFGVVKTTKWFYSASAKKISNKYDTVVAYQEELSTEYAQYIRAKRRIAWVHNDFCRFANGKTIEYEQKLYDHFDEIVCVSEASKKSMLDSLNLSEAHVHMIYNTIPKEYILQQSLKESDKLRRREFTFISMGRFAKQKGFDRAVEVAFRLKTAGLSFIWYIIGTGEDEKMIEQRIMEKGLQDHLILLGLKTNPFPYIKQADCFVMTSRYEAQPMVLNEALTLGIPVISTNFSSASEVVDENVNGLIVNNDEDGIFEGIMCYASDETVRKTITTGAKQFNYRNDEILDEIISLL